MAKDPTISEINKLFRRPSVTFQNGLTRTDSDAAMGYASDMKNFEVRYGVASRRRGSRCILNPITARKWRAFHETNISGADILLAISEDRTLKAFLDKWPEIEFSVYRQGVNPMNYYAGELNPIKSDESYEVRFDRGDEFWMDNEDSRYLKIINNYGDAIRISKRGYVQAMSTRNWGDDYKPSHQMDEARENTLGVALYMDVQDATNRNIYKFYTAERTDGETIRIENEVKVASVNECGVVGKLSDPIILPRPQEVLVSTVPVISISDQQVDLQYGGTVLNAPASEDPGAIYATRDEDGRVSYDSSANSPDGITIDFYLFVSEQKRIDGGDILCTLVPTTTGIELDEDYFYQFPPTMKITQVWNGQDFDVTGGTAIGYVNSSVDVEGVVSELPYNYYATDLDTYVAAAPSPSIIGTSAADKVYSFEPVNIAKEVLLEKFRAVDSQFALKSPLTSNIKMQGFAKGSFNITNLSSPYILANPAYKYKSDVIGVSSDFLGIVDKGMDVWESTGGVSVGSAPNIDVVTKKATLDISRPVNALINRSDANVYAGGLGNPGFGAKGRFALWNNKYIMGVSQLGWQNKDENFNFTYEVPDSKTGKSIDDTASTGRVVNQLPSGYENLRLQSCPVMSLHGAELRRRAYEEPLIYEPIQDPSHIVSNRGKVFVVQGSSLWIGNFSSLMLDTAVDVDFTVNRMEPFYDGALLFTNKGIKKVSAQGAITNVNVEQIKSEDVKSSCRAGSAVYAVTELEEVFQVVMIFEGTTVPYPKAILASAPVYAMDWGADPKMTYVDGTLWIAREGDAWGFYENAWTKQKDFEGKVVDHIFGFKNRLCVVFHDKEDIDSMDYYVPGTGRT